MSQSKRKTIKVEELLDYINNFLALPNHTAESREVGIAILTHFLFETGNYNGFKYLTENDLPEGVEPGIIRKDDYNHQYPDKTRVMFF